MSDPPPQPGAPVPFSLPRWRAPIMLVTVSMGMTVALAAAFSVGALGLQLVQLTLIVATLSILLHGFSVKPLLELFRRRS